VRAVLQRVMRASVSVDGELVGEIGAGLLILLGIAEGDTTDDVARLAKKAAELRIFNDSSGRFQLSLLDTQGEALVVSQFTLLADTRRGRRPSFVQAATPDIAAPLCDEFVVALQSLGLCVETGRFGASMQVELVNDGPVTIVLDSRDI
jgi:D-aminoacyl-tRNA deacylase